MTTKEYQYEHNDTYSSLRIRVNTGSTFISIEKLVYASGRFGWYHVNVYSFYPKPAKSMCWFYDNPSDLLTAWKNFRQLCEFFKEED